MAIFNCYVSSPEGKYDRSADAGRQGVYFSGIFDVVWIMDVIAYISDFNIIVFSVFFYVDRLEP